MSDLRLSSINLRAFGLKASLRSEAQLTRSARARSNNIASAAPLITSSSNMPASRMNSYSPSVAHARQTRRA